MRLYAILLVIFSLFSFQNFFEEIKNFANSTGNLIFKSLGLDNLVGNFLKNLNPQIKTAIYVILIIFVIVLALLILKNFVHLTILIAIFLVLLYILFNYF